MRFAFSDVELDCDRLELRRSGQRLALEPQAFDVLVYLVRHRDRVVAKEELMDQVWGGRFVSETAVTSRIKQVRRVLGDDGQNQLLIRTYHGRGYRFLPEVSESLSGTSSGAPADSPGRPAEPVLSCEAAGRRVRFQLSGQGPPDLLMLPAAPSLSAEWDYPERRSLLAGLGGRSRLIRWEADSAPPAPDAEEAGDVRTALAVLDAAATERAVVFSEDSAAILAARLAAALPERIAGLVLFGPAFPPPGDDAEADRTLAALTCPTLVLHRAGDPVVPIGAGRSVAARIPNAEFRALPGEHHVAAADSAQVLGAVEDFICDAAEVQAVDRHVTALLGLAGDDISSLVAVLLQLGGRRRQGPEQSVIVSFDGPASALRALSSRRARGLLDEVGIGLAIDEVSRESFLVSGHGVDVARLFARQAAPGEVLLPNVIKDLLAGSGLTVETLPPLDLPHVGPHPVHRWVRR